MGVDTRYRTAFCTPKLSKQQQALVLPQHARSSNANLHYLLPRRSLIVPHCTVPIQHVRPRPQVALLLYSEACCYGYTSVRASRERRRSGLPLCSMTGEISFDVRAAKWNVHQLCDLFFSDCSSEGNNEYFQYTYTHTVLRQYTHNK